MSHVVLGDSVGPSLASMLKGKQLRRKQTCVACRFVCLQKNGLVRAQLVKIASNLKHLAAKYALLLTCRLSALPTQAHALPLASMRVADWMPYWVKTSGDCSRQLGNIHISTNMCRCAPCIKDYEFWICGQPAKQVANVRARQPASQRPLLPRHQLCACVVVLLAF